MFKRERKLNSSREKKEMSSDCPVCLDTFDDPYILTQCGHTLCKRCIERTAQGRSTLRCPICRKTNQVNNVVPNFELRQLIDELMKRHEDMDGQHIDTKNHKVGDPPDKKTTKTGGRTKSWNVFKKKMYDEEGMKEPKEVSELWKSMDKDLKAEYFKIAEDMNKKNGFI